MRVNQLVRSVRRGNEVTVTYKNGPDRATVKLSTEKEAQRELKFIRMAKNVNGFDNLTLTKKHKITPLTILSAITLE